MNDATLKSYLEGWSSMCSGSPEAANAMVAGANPDVRFSDVNSPNQHVGHDGLRLICSIAAEKYPGATITCRDVLFDGRNWSVRWNFSGRSSDGKAFGWRGVSAGTVGDDGKVAEHTDYWSIAELQRQ